MKDWASNRLSFLKSISLWGTLGLLITHLLLANFGEREQIWRLWTLVSLAFFFYFILIKQKTLLSRKYIFFSALIFRIPYIGQEPLLSDDFFRFFWDGELWISGYNAYEWLPSAFVSKSQTVFSTELFYKLNSPNYYTVYPPLNQYLFIFATYLSDSDVTQFTTFLQIILLGIEMFILWIILKLSTNQLKFRPEIYYYNPLICLEFTGNIHFEGLVVSQEKLNEKYPCIVIVWWR